MTEADITSQLLREIRDNQQHSIALQREHLALYQRQLERVERINDRAEAIQRRSEAMQGRAIRILRWLGGLFALALVVLVMLYLI